MAIALSAINTGVIITLLFLSSAISIVLGGIAWSRIVSLFLPFPTSLGAISTLYPLLPFLAAFISNNIASRYQRSADSHKIRIESSSSSSGETVIDGGSNDDNNNNNTTDIIASNNNRTSSRRPLANTIYPFILSSVDHLLTLLPTVIATLAATYIAPSDNSCHLEQTWQAFYHNKDVRAIRTIQDHLQCCGLRSTRDRAWPFKDATHGDNSCETTTGYTRSCLQPWSEQERRVAGLVFVAAVLGWGIKMGISSLNTGFLSRGRRRNAWINRVNAGNVAGGESAGPRLLPFHDHVHQNAGSGQEGASNDDGDNDDELPIGTSPLVNPDSRDLTSPEGRDLTGAGPWRENV